MNKIYFISAGIVMIFLFWITSVSFAQVSDEKKYVFLEINYKNGIFTLMNKTLENGNYPIFEHSVENEYQFKLISENQDLLYSGFFDPTLIFSDSSNNEYFEGGAIRLNETSFFMILPDLKKADKFEILKNNTKVFETEVYNVGAKLCRIS